MMTSITTTTITMTTRTITSMTTPPMAPDNIDQSTKPFTKFLGKDIAMYHLISPFLASFIWVGGGSLGLVVVIVLIVLVLRG